jgi:branched-subunit amino acid aminotransferase/4-amino-4-deoxychorismate lyase
VHEFTIREVPCKPALLANCKTTNYLLNCLRTQKAFELAKEKEYLGINKDSKGFITEASVSNVAFVFENDVFVTTPFEKILKGTTLSMVIDKIEKHLKIKENGEQIPVK